MNDDKMTTTEAAKVLGYHPNYVRVLVRQGLLDAEKLGQTYLISTESVMKVKALQENGRLPRGTLD